MGPRSPEQLCERTVDACSASFDLTLWSKLNLTEQGSTEFENPRSTTLNFDPKYADPLDVHAIAFQHQQEAGVMSSYSYGASFTVEKNGEEFSYGTLSRSTEN